MPLINLATGMLDEDIQLPRTFDPFTLLPPAVDTAPTSGGTGTTTGDVPVIPPIVPTVPTTPVRDPIPGIDPTGQGGLPDDFIRNLFNFSGPLTEDIFLGLTRQGFAPGQTGFERGPLAPTSENRDLLVRQANLAGLPWRAVRGDKIDLGDGRIADVILASTGPLEGRRWQLLFDDGTASAPFPSPDPGGVPGGTAFGPDATVPQVPIQDFGLPQFDDPGAALLEDLLKIRIQELNAARENPRLQQLVDTLQGQFESEDERLQTLFGDIEGRIEQLRGAPFTRGEEELLRTRALDRISAQQDATINRVLEEFGAMGRAPTSGVNAQILANLGSQFSGQRTQAESDFARFAAQEHQNRLNQALGLSGQLQSLDRSRRNELATLGTQIAAIEEQVRQQEQQRRREAIANASLLSEMPERRLQLALATLGVQPPPDSLFNSLAQLAGLNQGQSSIALQAQALQNQLDQTNQQNQALLFSGLGGLFGGFGGGNDANAPLTGTIF